MRQNTTANWVNTSFFSSGCCHSCTHVASRSCPNLHETIKYVCNEWIEGIDRSLMMRTACDIDESVRMTKFHLCRMFFTFPSRHVQMYRQFCRHPGMGIVIKPVSYPIRAIRLKSTIRTSTACERVSTHCISNSWPKYVIGSSPHTVEYL